MITERTVIHYVTTDGTKFLDREDAVLYERRKVLEAFISQIIDADVSDDMITLLADRMIAHRTRLLAILTDEVPK